ncbi:ECF RNA polymerase sigma factor SigK [Pirellulimonas nuda]|uniref:ECF RNA polymerase sigma factor SigK n=1 Tax=Pirellulimonas nuda TaxID=2528009 RepID=A0A518D677_9BACT|nr:sigma-70 family RNA polymerase sigma factor [Pirellulimonas nuda]QDU86976.1 ECF RNA polymerase sigma factor SigK [Pirellulimonas nuda]
MTPANSQSEADQRPAEAAEHVALLARVAEGDEAAFGRLYDEYAPNVYGIAMRILKNPADAQEVLSEVFWQVWRDPTKYAPERGTLLSYLLTVARSRALDKLRKSTTRRARLPTGGAPAGLEPVDSCRIDSPDQRLMDDERRREVVGAIQGLSDAQRRALTLAYFDGLTHREVAEQLELPLGTAKSHIRKGLESLRVALSAFRTC